MACSVATKASIFRPLADAAMARSAQPAARVAAAMAWIEAGNVAVAVAEALIKVLLKS